MHRSLKARKQKGQGLVEYALILVLVAVLVIAVLMILGPTIGNVFTRINSDVAGVSGSIPGNGGNPPVPTAVPNTPVPTPAEISFICPPPPDCTTNCTGGVIDITINGSYSTWLTCVVGETVTVSDTSYGVPNDFVEFHVGTFGAIPADGTGPVVASYIHP